MPAQQRLRSDGERRTASAGERPRERREQRPVAHPVADTSPLASQHAELVAQDEDLKLLGIPGAAEQDEELEDPAEHQVRESTHHLRSTNKGAAGWRAAAIAVASSGRSRVLRCDRVYAPCGP
jgi:hypothetical protein